MIKTLRITSIIAAILGAGLLVFPVFFGYRGNEEIEKFLERPNAIDKFKEVRGSKGKVAAGQISPLVKQAGDFARYLNPPKLVAVVPSPPREGGLSQPPPPPPPPPPTTPKFTLKATSFYESRPEMSLALIDEPGIGQHWVRQGAVVSNLTIEQVKEGAISVKSGKETFELAVPRVAIRSLLAEPPTEASASYPAGATVPVVAAPALGHTPTYVSVPVQPAQPEVSEAELLSKLQALLRAESERIIQEGGDSQSAATIEQLKGRIEGMRAGAGSNKIDAPARPEPTASEAPLSTQPTRITGEEAGKLDRLGQELKDGQQPPRPGTPTDSAEWRKRLEERRQMLRERSLRAKARPEENKPADQ